jgi:hypothetical protein
MLPASVCLSLSRPDHLSWTLEIDWEAGSVLSSSGTMGHVAASFTNPIGFSVDNFRIKVPSISSTPSFPTHPSSPLLRLMEEC